MGKPKSERRVGETEAMAVLKNLRTGARRLTLVAEPIRGLPPARPRAQLGFEKGRIPGGGRKVLQAAIANAENTHQLDVDRLYVKEATVGRGMVMKRFHARARGRGARIEKPFSDLTVI